MVFNLAEAHCLNHFEVDLTKLDIVVDFVHSLIKRDYANLNEIPPHSRWRHFNVNNVSRLDSLCSNDKMEWTMLMLDLFVVSVLLDAGAGPSWKFHEKKTNLNISRSEGLAVASLEMFMNGLFSSNPDLPCQVDSKGLANLTLENLKSGFQISDSNQMAGLEGRYELLKRLGTVLTDNSVYFPGIVARPGNLVHYLISHESTVKTSNKGYKVDVNALWKIVMEGFSSVWPSSRTRLNGVSLGDVWPCEALKGLLPANEEPFVPFHKLSQWLVYSLMEPMEKILNVKFFNVELMTGLPEYRNGGLFIDFGVLKLKNSMSSDSEDVKFKVEDDLIVEWRALTVVLLDKTSEMLRLKLGLENSQLPLAKVLEAGTWKAGREIAAKLRPKTKGPPLTIISDGTVF